MKYYASGGGCKELLTEFLGVLSNQGRSGSGGLVVLIQSAIRGR